jgi:hypothetical protein
VMFLHASEVKCQHPLTSQDLHFTANMHSQFSRILGILDGMNISDVLSEGHTDDGYVFCSTAALSSSCQQQQQRQDDDDTITGS